MLRAALTLDDAPIMLGSRLERSPLDAVREALARLSVKRCVAFVIGARVPGHEAALGRWLDAGYELGNHSHEHAFASHIGSSAFLASVRRCDELIAKLGAFDRGRSRYFRYPYGDRGATREDRTRIAAGLRELGYRIADVSLSLHDHCYEAPLETAVTQGNLTSARAIERRFLMHIGSLPRRAAATRRNFVHVIGGHFGRIAERALEPAVASLLEHLELCDLEQAVDQAVFTELHADTGKNGVAEDHLYRSLRHRALRRAARMARNRGWLAQSRLGPLWPHLSD